MKLILKYIKPYWIMAAAAPVLMLMEVFMDLMQPTLMARIIDEGIAVSDMPVMLETGFLMIAVAVIGLVGGVGCSITSSFASTGMAKKLRAALYAKVLSFSSRNTDSIGTSGIITRLTNDVVQIENMVRMGLRIMIRAPLQVVGSLVLAIIISPGLSIVFLPLIPLILITITIIVRKSMPLFSRLQAKMDVLNLRMQETLAGIRLVKAFVRQDYEIEKFTKANDELTEVNTRAVRIISFSHPLMMVFLNLGVVAILWLGSGHVWSGDLMIGKVIAFINYMMQLLMSLIMISQILMNLSRAQASIHRLEEVFAADPSIDDPGQPADDTAIDGRIEFRNVSFSYDGASGDPVLKDVNFTIEPGEKIAILGATGSGKSTIVSLVPRLYDVSSGEVLVGGTDVRNRSVNALRADIGMAPQKTILFSGSIGGNISYRSGDDSDCGRYAAMASIDGFIESLPEGYKTDVNQRGVNLSGGQKQRISIARALYGDPPIIILDDSTSAVDSKTESSIFSAIDGMKGSTVLIVAQKISTAVHADRIILLEDGKVAGMGSHAELLEGNPIYREILKSQTGLEGGAS